MIHTQLGTVVENWSEVTLEQAIKLTAINIPVDLDTFDLFKHIDKIKDCFTVMSSLTRDEVDMINPNSIVHFYHKNLQKYVDDLHRSAPVSYIPKLIDSFEFDGVEYHMPTSLIVDDETVILQHGQDVKRFVESSNLFKRYSELKDDGIKVMPMFIASVVKQDIDEPFDEQVITKRAEQFKQLPMSVVWEVFFCISQLTLKSLQFTLQSIAQEERGMMPLPKKLPERLVMKLGRLRLRRAALQAKWKMLTE
jgi:hypothetical protein